MKPVEMKEYSVGVTILECFTIMAVSGEEAEEKVREMVASDQSDFNINYVDEVIA